MKSLCRDIYLQVMQMGCVLGFTVDHCPKMWNHCWKQQPLLQGEGIIHLALLLKNTKSDQEAQPLFHHHSIEYESNSGLVNLKENNGDTNKNK